MSADMNNFTDPLTRNSGHGREGSLTQGPPDRQHVTGVGASSDMVPASFHTQVICGILCLPQFFLPPTIFLHLNVGCMSASKVEQEEEGELIDLCFIFFFYNFYLFFNIVLIEF